jgi:uncharacterized membrane protein
VLGAEYRAPGVSYEYAVATNWLLRCGIVILVVGIGFFLKYSMQKGYLGPQGRVALSIVAGLAMLSIGIRLIGKLYHLIGQGLMGGGIATLYFSIFAASSLYHLIGSIYLAFGLMAFITFAAGFLAVRLNSMLVAVLGIIGGYATPVLLSTGVKNFVGLYSYLLILGIGILGIAWHKRWYVLNYLAFLGTYGLYFAAHARFYDASTDFWRVFPFLLTFFALFSSINFIYNFAQRQKATLLELLALLANSAILYGSGYDLIFHTYSRTWVAALTIGLTVYYIAHVYLFLWRKLLDRTLLFTFLALASFFLSVSLPLLLTREWLTVSWALQALVMLCLAMRLGSNFLKWLAMAVYAMVLWRLAAWDLPRHFTGDGARALHALPTAGYLKLLFERVVIFGVTIASFGGAWLVMKKEPDARTPEMPVSEGNDMPAVIRSGSMGTVLAGIALVTVFAYLQLEFDSFFGVFFDPFRLPVLTMLWVALATLVVVICVRTHSPVALAALVLVCIVMIGKFFALDWMGWHPSLFQQHYDAPYSGTIALMRLLDFSVLVAFMALAARMLFRGDVPAGRAASTVAAGTALGLLFIYLTFETSSALFTYLPKMRAGGVSIVWSLYALGLVLTGILRQSRALRYVGLVLFAWVVVKVFFYDLDKLDQLYRIIAFVVLGVLFLCGSLLYLKYHQKLGVVTRTDTDKHGVSS